MIEVFNTYIEDYDLFKNQYHAHEYFKNKPLARAVYILIYDLGQLSPEEITVMINIMANKLSVPETSTEEIEKIILDMSDLNIIGIISVNGSIYPTMNDYSTEI